MYNNAMLPVSVLTCGAAHVQYDVVRAIRACDMSLCSATTFSIYSEPMVHCLKREGVSGVFCGRVVQVDRLRCQI